LQELGDFVQEQRNSLDGGEFEGSHHSDELLSILKTEDRLVAEIEGNVSKCRKLVILNQQYAALVGEVQSFISRFTPILSGIKSGPASVESKLRQCDELIGPLQEAEAKLSTATDKGAQIMEEVGVEDRNGIVRELQEIKQGLHSLRTAASTLRAEFEQLASEHLKAAGELDVGINWLHDKEGTIKSRPHLHISNCEEELRAQMALETDVNSRLIDLEEILEGMGQDETLPSALIEKVNEAKSLLKRIPEELRSRGNYLRENAEMREKYSRLFGEVREWAAGVENGLNNEDVLKDIENAGKHAQELKSIFGSEELAGKMQNLKKLLERILPSLLSGDQDAVAKEFKSLEESVNNLKKKVHNCQIQLEKDHENWENYVELTKGLDELLLQIQIPTELGANLPQLKSSDVTIKACAGKIKVSHHLNFL